MADKTSSKAGSRSTPGGIGSGGEKSQTEDQKRTKRRRFYASIMKREIGKAQKARNFNQVRISVQVFVLCSSNKNKQRTHRRKYNLFTESDTRELIS